MGVILRLGDGLLHKVGVRRIDFREEGRRQVGTNELVRIRVNIMLNIA